MEGSWLKFIPKIIIQMCILTLTLVSYFILPIIILTVFLPMHIFRYTIYKLSWIFRPDLAKILTTISSSFVIKIPFVYSHPKNTILVYGVLDGHVDLANFRESFNTLLDTKDPKGNLIYPEMKQYITNWCGFFFWKGVEEFRIEDHIKFYESRYLEVMPKEDINLTELNTNTVVRLAQNIIKRPFVMEKSPWEFVLLHNDDKDDAPKKTAFMIRLHHSLADGYSLFNLVLKHAKANIEQAKPNFNRGPSFRRALKPILFPFRMPYEMISQLFHCYDVNDWHIPEKTMARDNCGVITTTVSTQYVKNIKNIHQASFAGVILTAFAGGIRKSMIQNKVKVPKHIHCLTPLPLPNHPEKLRNFMGGCFVKLPVDIASPHQRLKAVEKNLKRIKNSTRVQTNYVMNQAVGGAVSFISKALWKPVLCTSTLSSFPGPEKESFYHGHRIISSGFMGNVDVGNIGINMTMFSYNGNLDICLTVDKNILGTNEKERELMENVVTELHILTKEDIV